MAERIEGRSVTNPLFFEDHDPIADVAVRSSYDLSPDPPRNVNVRHSILPTWRQITPAPPPVSAPVNTVIIVTTQLQEEVRVPTAGTQDPPSIEQAPKDEETQLADLTEEEKQEIRDIGEQLSTWSETRQDESRSKFSSDTCLSSLHCNFNKIKSLYQCGGRRRRTPPPTKSLPTNVQQMASVSGSLPPCAGATAAVVTQKNAKAVDAEDLLTDDLKDGRSSGWRIYAKYAFPMVNDIMRDIWVCGELATILFSIIFSAVTFGMGSADVFNVIHLVLSIIATLLALIDSFLQLKDLKSCRACKRYHRNVRKGKQGTQEDTDSEPKGFICCSCLKLDEEVKTESETESAKKRCSAGWWKDVGDVLRTFVSEAIFYPLLICDIFEFITARGWRLETQEERVSFALFVISAFAIVLYAYVARVALLCFTIYNVQKKRRASENWYASLGFQIWFAVHVFLQMLAQIFMLIAIGAKIQYENRNYNSNDPNSHMHIRVSSYLWYMIIAGYIMPFIGLLTFYLVAFFWAQEFPIGVCVDFLKILATPSAGFLFNPNKSAKQHSEDILRSLDEPDYTKWNALLERLQFRQMKENFANLRNKGFFDKFAYPFKSPVIVILCIAYAAFQFAFIICAVMADDSDNPVVLTEGSGWSIFYAIGVIVGIIANLYIFSIAALWVTIILLVIAAVIAAILFWCALICLLGQADNSSRNH